MLDDEYLDVPSGHSGAGSADNVPMPGHDSGGTLEDSEQGHVSDTQSIPVSNEGMSSPQNSDNSDNSVYSPELYEAINLRTAEKGNNKKIVR